MDNICAFDPRGVDAGFHEASNQGDARMNRRELTLGAAAAAMATPALAQTAYQPQASTSDSPYFSAFNAQIGRLPTEEQAELLEIMVGGISHAREAEWHTASDLPDLPVAGPDAFVDEADFIALPATSTD